MAKIIQAFQDGKGKLFPCLEDATISDLTQLFGRQGSSEEQASLTIGICRTILSNAKEIRAILDAHDALDKESKESKALPTATEDHPRPAPPPSP